jgi:hypothetical protein
MVTYPAPDCCFCKHFKDWDEKEEVFTCAAFPKGIPKVIWLEGRKHDRPYTGDNGIRFASAVTQPKSVNPA